MRKGTPRQPVEQAFQPAQLQRQAGKPAVRRPEESLFELLHRITDVRERTPRGLAALIGVSGIDASGKGYIAGRLANDLEQRGYRVALINVDGWLNLPDLRFLNRYGPTKVHGQTTQGTHFYRHALRLDEMFSDLILPLKEDRSIELTMDFAEETATEFRPYTVTFTDIDIILLEGIFIFKRQYVQHFDLKIWIECSFDTALSRAISRGQEGLPKDETIAAYNTIYFPAQRVHFDIDDPRTAADLIYRNE